MPMRATALHGRRAILRRQSPLVGRLNYEFEGAQLRYPNSFQQCCSDKPYLSSTRAGRNWSFLCEAKPAADEMARARLVDLTSRCEFRAIISPERRKRLVPAHLMLNLCRRPIGTFSPIECLLRRQPFSPTHQSMCRGDPVSMSAKSQAQPLRRR